MIAMLLAAQLSAEIVRGMPAGRIQPLDMAPMRSDELTRVKVAPWRRSLLEAPQVICPSQGAMQTSDSATPALLLRPEDRKSIRLKKLGDLPKANKEIAVLRTVAGCAVPVGVRYDVEGNGKFANGEGQ